MMSKFVDCGIARGLHLLLLCIEHDDNAGEILVGRLIYMGLAALLLTGALAQARVYKWVDENGGVVFSQMPPPDDIAAEEVRVRTATPVQKKDAEQLVPVEASKEKVTGEKPASKKAQDQESRQQYCDKVRKNLKVLIEAGSDSDMAFVTEDGKLLKFDFEEKERRIKELSENFEKYCSQ